MSLRLEQPPKQYASNEERERWFHTLWLVVKDFRRHPTTSGDAADSIPPEASYHGVTALTAPRTLTLPLAADLGEGREIMVQDESGAAGTHAITIQRAGSDTINGATSVTINTNYGRKVIVKRNGKYFAA